MYYNNWIPFFSQYIHYATLYNAYMCCVRELAYASYIFVYTNSSVVTICVHWYQCRHYLCTLTSVSSLFAHFHHCLRGICGWLYPACDHRFPAISFVADTRLARFCQQITALAWRVNRTADCCGWSGNRVTSLWFELQWDYTFCCEKCHRYQRWKIVVIFRISSL